MAPLRGWGPRGQRLIGKAPFRRWKTMTFIAALRQDSSGSIEKIFGTWKRSYGLRRMRWKGLAKAALQVRLTAIAYNMKRTANILAA